MKQYTINLQVTPTYAEATEPAIILSPESARGVPVNEAVDVDALTAALKAFAAKDGVVVGPDGREVGKLRVRGEREFAVATDDAARPLVDSGTLRQALVTISQSGGIVEVRLVDRATPSAIAQAAHASFAKARLAGKRAMVFSHPIQPSNAIAKGAKTPPMSPLTKAHLMGRHVFTLPE